MSDFEKALNSAVTQGGDLIIPQLADQIIPFIRQKSYLRQFVQSFNMPTETFRFPKLSTGNSVYGITEGSVAPESRVSTGTVELNAKKFMVNLAISAELQEDSILPIIPVIRADMAKAFALAEEDSFINGDTAHLATQLDENLATEANWYVNDPRRMFDGLKKVGDATPVDLNFTKLKLADISKAIYSLDKFGRDKSELLFIVSLREESVLRSLLGVDLATNQLGLTGTALPNEIGKVWGVPVVSTNLLRVDMGNQEASDAIMLNRNAAVIGDRRIFVIKSSDEVLLASDQLLIVASERIAFAAVYSKAIAKIININEVTP